MSGKWQDVARRLVADERWRWRGGMVSEGWRILFGRDDGVCVAQSSLATRDWHIPSIPDLRDPATVGVIRAEVERICGDRGLAVTWYCPTTKPEPAREYCCRMFNNRTVCMNVRGFGAGVCAAEALLWLWAQEP